MEQVGIIDFHEGGTTGRWCHHIVKLGEEFVYLPGYPLGHSFKSGIGHGLSTTGLVERIVHIESQMGEQFIGSHAHLWIEGVYIAGYEKTYLHLYVSCLVIWF